MSLETLVPYLFLSGLAILGLGWLALIFAAFRLSAKWGLASLVFPPAGIAFAIRHTRRAAWPLAIMGLGWALFSVPIVHRLLPIDLGPRDKVVDGRRVVTLTGWDRPPSEYERALAQRPDTSTLQMANADVTDAALAAVGRLAQLRELDLNTSQVTDAGLSALKDLQGLETIRLSQTGVTDAGFQAVLARLPSLKRIDLRGTKVSREAAQSWKAEKTGRSVMQ